MGICVRCSAEIPISRPSLPLVRTSASVWLRSWPLFFRFWLQIYLSLWDVLPAAAPALESNLNFTPKSCCCMYLGLLRLPAFFVAALRSIILIAWPARSSTSSPPSRVGTVVEPQSAGCSTIGTSSGLRCVSSWTCSAAWRLCLALAATAGLLLAALAGCPRALGNLDVWSRGAAGLESLAGCSATSDVFVSTTDLQRPPSSALSFAVAQGLASSRSPSTLRIYLGLRSSSWLEFVFEL